MNVAHIFPILNSSPMDGSELYELMLSKYLKQKGIHVDIYTTKSSKVLFSSAFSLKWIDEYKQRETEVQGIRTLRFDCVNIPQFLGYIISKAILYQWKIEKTQIEKDEDLSLTYFKNAEERKGIYDLLAQIGRGPISWRMMWDLSRRIDSYDLILVGFVPFSTIPLVTWIAKRYKKKVVIIPFFHMEDRYHYWKSFFKAFRSADAVLALNLGTYSFFKNIVGVPNVIHIGGAIDPNEFSNMQEAAEGFRKDQGLQKHKILLFVGRKEYTKKYQMIIEAVEILKDTHIKLLIIGRDVDHIPIHSKYVEYLGVLPRRKLLSAYAACDIFISPSIHESLGITFLEAWMFKKPVIGNKNCAAVASLIKDGVNGFLCRNSEEMAEKIKLLLQKKEVAEYLGKNGYDLTVNEYTWEKVVDRVLAVYQQIIQPKKC